MDKNERAAFIVVNVERESEALPHVLEALNQRGITTEMVGQGRQLRRAAAIVLKIEPERAAEALLALELEGFADVLAYSLDEA